MDKKRSEVGLNSTRRRITESERRGPANRGLKGRDATEERRDESVVNMVGIILIFLKILAAALELLKMGFRGLEMG